MISLDTSIVIRFLVNDDKTQAEKVRSLFADAEAGDENLFITNLVLLEVIWVLDAVYGCTRNEIVTAIEELHLLKVIRFESTIVTKDLCSLGRSTKTDLPDILIGLFSRNANCETTLTFDKKASKSPLFSLL